MSYDQSSNPYAKPPGRESSPLSQARSLQFLVTFQYIFENPSWLANICLAGICVLVPVIGPIIAWGYMFVVTEHLLRRSGPTYPNFDFGRFSDYLMRGIWPFIVVMIANVVLTPVMLVMIYGPMICGGVFAAAIAEGGGNGEGEALVGACFLCGVVIMFVGILVLSFLSALLIVPMMLAAGLSQELGPAFNFAYLKDFAAKMWKEVLLMVLFLMVVSQLLAMLGLMLLCIGIIPVAGAMGLSQAHFLFQLYELYVARGGMAIALKEGK